MKIFLFKSWVIFFAFLLFVNKTESQEIIAFLSLDGSIKVEPTGEKNEKSRLIVKYDDNNGTSDSAIIIAEEFQIDTLHVYLRGYEMEYKFDQDGKVLFAKHKPDRDVFFCNACNCFALGSCAGSLKDSKREVNTSKSSGLAPDFPFPPQFSPRPDAFSGLVSLDSMPYYHLVIDANADIMHKANNTLYEKTMKKGASPVFKVARFLRVNSSLSIYISNYNFASVEDINISVNGRDHHYAQSVGDIYNMVQPEVKEKEGIDSIKVTSDKGVELTDSLKAVKDNLEWAFNQYLNKYTSLNINDIVLLNQYKANLSKFFAAHPGLFSEEAVVLLNRILVWNPLMVSLSPIAVTIPDSDEVEFELKIRNKGVAEKTYSLGSYYVKGKASVVAGAKGSLFFTKLKNREAFIDSADHKARMDNKHRMSVGIGASGILSFRTGDAWTPTINLGFFVPLGEDISSFGYFGPGINYGTQKVGFNLSGGVAFGKVNSIKAQYNNIDMRTINNLDVNGITEKVWEAEWCFSVGLSFNITK